MEKKIELKKSVSDLLSVGEISARSGVSISALHFYERKGLIKAIRNSQNQRRYPRGILRVISLIKVGQNIGHSLEEIKELLKNLPTTDEKPSERDWRRISSAWKKKLVERIKLLTKLNDQLDSCIGCGCLSLKECPLRNNNDELANRGSGPHLLEI